MTNETQYPEPDAQRSGCKVGWYYYRDETKAKAASDCAKRDAIIQASLGYDFGYPSPGYITKIREGERAGMWKVCIP